MKYYRRKGQIDLTDRLAIETGLCRGESFKRIAKTIGRHPSTVAHEVLQNRTYIHATYCADKDCRYARKCVKRGICGTEGSACSYYCKYCKGFDCRSVCKDYCSVACHKPEKPPYVCNTCDKRKICIKDKYLYTANYADAAVSRRRSDSRKGIRLTEKQKKAVEELLGPLIKKGQPLTHIYMEHENELPMSLRSLYNYIDQGKLSIKNIDLRRKVGYRQRRKALKDKAEGKNLTDQSYREGRTYEDYERFIKYTAPSVVEMDTVKGRREKGKRLLTMIFQDNSIMLLFLMPDGKAESVKRVFDYLEKGLGTECFQRITEESLSEPEN